MTNTNDLQTIAILDLHTVTGGGATTAALKTGAKVAGKWGAKAIPFVNAASTAYDAYQGGKAAYDSYKAGNGVGRAAWDGAKGFAKSFVGLD
jgi:hypothetical protein